MPNCKNALGVIRALALGLSSRLKGGQRLVGINPRLLAAGGGWGG